ncbi:DUF5085 family protein, partial [Staphylococcus sp. EG-SA-23]|uniref:DUF5085 family protein n=1 Tax=Staphylococcus sp. EG-SA-23 TaxID=2767497 RepID=UPI001F11B6DA
VKITFEIDKNDNWLNALDTVNEFFMDKDIYPTGPIIFQRELAKDGINSGINKVKSGFGKVTSGFKTVFG